MSRAIDGTKRNNRRSKILKLASGFTGRRGTNYKAAKDAVVKALRHDVTLASRWRFISLSVDYMHMTDAIYDWTSPYDDNGVVLIGMVNFDRPIDCISAYLNIAPTVGCWTTSNVIGIQKQWLSYSHRDAP